MKIAFFSSALLVASTAMGATPINGWYSSIFSGANYIPDNLSVTRHFALTDTFFDPGYKFTLTNAAYDIGYDVGLRLGFQCNPIRYEAEVTYLNAEVEHFSINKLRQNRASGDIDSFFAMANIYYDFPDMVPAISPFLGVGLGYGWISGNYNKNFYYYPTSYSLPLYYAINYSSSNSVFAYQVTGGLTYNFSENYAFTLAYRYIGTDRVEGLGKVFQAHLATAGVLYRFNEINYK
ncbi:outer membrane protein [Legionella sp. D16C41]|uniref:outer membrane protein n=1 Tax=Legionella sp. D16C41 TaxID=3402688 RepID=UPI003AF52CBD